MVGDLSVNLRIVAKKSKARAHWQPVTICENSVASVVPGNYLYIF